MHAANECVQYAGICDGVCLVALAVAKLCLERWRPQFARNYWLAAMRARLRVTDALQVRKDDVPGQPIKLTFLGSYAL